MKGKKYKEVIISNKDVATIRVAFRAFMAKRGKKIHQLGIKKKEPGTEPIEELAKEIEALIHPQVELEDDYIDDINLIQ